MLLIGKVDTDGFCFKRKMFLRQVAKCNNNYCCKNFGNCRINMKTVNKQPNKKVVKPNTYQHYKKISAKLHPATYRTLRKHYIPAKIKARWKGYQKGCNQRGCVRL